MAGTPRTHPAAWTGVIIASSASASQASSWSRQPARFLGRYRPHLPRWDRRFRDEAGRFRHAEGVHPSWRRPGRAPDRPRSPPEDGAARRHEQGAALAGLRLSARAWRIGAWTPQPLPSPLTRPPCPARPAPCSRRPPAPASRLRRLATPVGVMAVVVGAFGYVAAVDPERIRPLPGLPACSAFTGLLCPGCGGLRSAHAFAHGDLAAALGANALAVVGYAVFAVVWLLWAGPREPGPARAHRPRARPTGGLSARCSLVFSVVRNLPFGSALAP